MPRVNKNKCPVPVKKHCRSKPGKGNKLTLAERIKEARRFLRKQGYSI